MSDDTPSSDSAARSEREMVAGDGARMLFCTVPPGKAQKLALALVDEGLVACVNLVPGLRSIYRWRGQIADEPETLLILKTTAARVDALAARLCELHPYEQPELLSLTPDRGLKGYLGWLEAAAGDSASS